MKQHKNFEPSEYEQMLITAGWVTAESLDDEYIEYQQKIGVDDVGYESWKSLRRDWNELNAQYDKEIQPLWDSHEYDTNGLPFTYAELEKHLLKQMGFIECVLGY